MNSNFIFKFLISICSVFMLLSSAAGADEMNWILKGKVLEKGTRKPVFGAAISVQEISSISTVSDENGNFMLTFPQPGKYIVMAAFIGESKLASKTINLETGAAPPILTFYLLAPSVLPEVVVNAERNPNQVGKTVIKGEELRQIAGSSGDPLKGLQSLPGVAMSNSGGSAPAVRGSGPGDNFYYADSIPVGKMFHYGGISVFNGDLIDNFNLYSAAFAPYFDNVTGAILDITLRNPRTDRLGGKVNISMTGADFLIEGPASAGQSFYFTARRSYFDLLLHSIERKGVTLQIPNYSDYQGKYIWNINSDNRLTAQLIGAADNLNANIASDSDIAKTQPDLAGALSFKDASATEAVVWDSKFSSTINNKLIAGHRTNSTDGSAGMAGTIYTLSNTSFVREKIILPVNDKHELTLASNVSNSDVGLNLNVKNTNCTQFNTGCDLTSAPFVQLNDNFVATAWDAAAQDRWHILPTLTLIGGIRHSKDNYLNQSYTEPRVGVEWSWSEDTLLTAGWGRHNQQPTGQQIAPKFGNPQLTHIRADHSVVGISQKLGIDWSWKVEAYYKRFSDLVVGINDPTINYVNGASGAAYGTELLIKKEATDRAAIRLVCTDIIQIRTT